MQVVQWVVATSAVAPWLWVFRSGVVAGGAKTQPPCLPALLVQSPTMMDHQI